MKIKWCAVALAVIFLGCSEKVQDPRQEILNILEIQETAYDVQSEENIKRFVETCTDSLIFVGGDDGGMLMTPQLYVRDFADGYIKRPYDRKITCYENTVIVTSLHQAYKILAGDTLLLNVRSTKVFVKDPEAWKMAYVTYAPLAHPYYRPTKPNPILFKDYVGIYDLGKGMRDSVYIEGEKLFSGGSELIPINDSTFVGEGYFGKSIFGKDYYTFEWNDGQRIKFRKVD